MKTPEDGASKKHKKSKDHGHKHEEDNKIILDADEFVLKTSSKAGQSKPIPFSGKRHGKFRTGEKSANVKSSRVILKHQFPNADRVAIGVHMPFSPVLYSKKRLADNGESKDKIALQELAVDREAGKSPFAKFVPTYYRTFVGSA